MLREFSLTFSFVLLQYLNIAKEIILNHREPEFFD